VPPEPRRQSRCAEYVPRQAVLVATVQVRAYSRAVCRPSAWSQWNERPRRARYRTTRRHLAQPASVCLEEASAQEILVDPRRVHPARIDLRRLVAGHRPARCEGLRHKVSRVRTKGRGYGLQFQSHHEWRPGTCQSR
jgi:hypothetical protein